jgi:hypothetical protein
MLHCSYEGGADEWENEVYPDAEREVEGRFNLPERTLKSPAPWVRSLLCGIAGRQGAEEAHGEGQKKDKSKVSTDKHCDQTLYR